MKHNLSIALKLVYIRNIHCKVGHIPFFRMANHHSVHSKTYPNTMCPMQIKYIYLFNVSIICVFNEFFLGFKHQII